MPILATAFYHIDTDVSSLFLSSRRERPVYGAAGPVCARGDGSRTRRAPRHCPGLSCSRSTIGTTAGRPTNTMRHQGRMTSTRTRPDVTDGDGVRAKAARHPRRRRPKSRPAGRMTRHRSVHSDGRLPSLDTRRSGRMSACGAPATGGTRARVCTKPGP